MNDKKPDLIIGQSGKRHYLDPVDADIEEIDRHEWDEIKEAQQAKRAEEGFPDQGHKLSDGSFKDGDGTITSPAEPHLTEWDES